MLAGSALGMSVVPLTRGGLPLCLRVARGGGELTSFGGLASGTGDPGALIGLISREGGLIGEREVRTDPGVSTFFHLVDEAEVDIGVGRDERCFPEVAETGVRWSKNFGP